jgi:SAM-dependent methyltransferase
VTFNDLHNGAEESPSFQMTNVPHDASNGYEEHAERFIAGRGRHPGVGAETVREWSRALPRGAAILDLGCGPGVPISQALIEEGFALYGVDASPTMIAAFRERFPEAHAECAAVEDSGFFGRTFDGVVAWGLMFLLPIDVQTRVIGKVARVLNRGGTFLFTSPKEAATWPDALTRRESISRGADVYEQILRGEGLTLVGETSDEGDNHYYLASKP